MIDGKLLIEIRKAGFVNKGAELMLCSILEKLANEFPNAELAMMPSVSNGYAPYLKRAKNGFYQKASFWKKGIQLGWLASLVPEKIREMYGIVLDDQIDIVIDSAGFAYSDQWGGYSCLELADSCKRWKKNGVKVVLMPQAFGPFKSKLNQKAIREMLDSVDLIFARDRISYDYLVSIAGERSNLKLAPDFTNLIKGIVPDDFDRENNRFCIVPNFRMIDKTNKNDSEAYLPFMIEVTRYAYDKKQKPFILVHEGEYDLFLAEKIRASVSNDVQIIKETHPLKIKGILGVSSGSVGSRFHGLVSALSQGTPALATGWSHKYKMLFEDYGFPEGVLNVQTSTKELHETMNLIIDEEKRRAIVETLKIKSDDLKQQSRKMWDDVLAVLKS